MGADLCGHFLILPEKNTNKIFNDHLKQLKMLVAKSTSVTAIKSLSGEKTAYTPEQVIGALQKLGVDTQHYSEFLGEDDDAELIEHISNDIGLVDEQGLDLNARDCNGTSRTINGQPVSIYFAGEMSWGDGPEGRGYKLIEMLWHLGFAQKFEDAINFGNKKKG